MAAPAHALQHNLTSVVNLHPTTCNPPQAADRVGLAAVRVARRMFDLATGYGPNMTEAKWLHVGLGGPAASALAHYHPSVPQAHRCVRTTVLHSQQPTGHPCAVPNAPRQTPSP